MIRPRSLVVVADDYGIGPETSRGILELALERRITATVLLVNSPYAEAAVAAWERSGRPIELGWHPCLTLDAPLLPPEKVPSLVNAEGRFWSLGQFLRRVCTGRISGAETAAEFRAQYDLFWDMVGRPPSVVNAHQHVVVFPPIGSALLELFADGMPRPYLRCVRESAATLLHVPGAKLKRTVLTMLGRRLARRSEQLGMPGCETLIGITDPPCVADERFYIRWLERAKSQTVELGCHPGYHDETLIGRDCLADDAFVARRVHELHLMRSPDFSEAVGRAGFRVSSPAELTGSGRQAWAA